MCAVECRAGHVCQSVSLPASQPVQSAAWLLVRRMGVADPSINQSFHVERTAGTGVVGRPRGGRPRRRLVGGPGCGRSSTSPWWRRRSGTPSRACGAVGRKCAWGQGRGGRRGRPGRGGCGGGARGEHGGGRGAAGPLGRLLLALGGVREGGDGDAEGRLAAARTAAAAAAAVAVVVAHLSPPRPVPWAGADSDSPLGLSLA